MDDQKSLSEIDKLRQKLQSATLPANLKERALEQVDRINLTLKFGGNLAQLDIVEKYIDWITTLPWETRTEDSLDVNHAKEILDGTHFGLDKIKRRILEYLSVLILQKQNLKAESFHAPSLFFVGLAGTGKTSIVKSIAEALNRKYVRIPFGGLSSALDLRGQSKTSPESEPGMIIKALRRAGSRNPIILLDELDRITPESRASIMGVLLEILDPKQNMNFTDYFVDYPFDLSQVLFIATANNTNNISTAVLDRLEIIQMPSYNDDEKITIGKNFLVPQYLKDAGLTPQHLIIDDTVWPQIVRPLGFDSGVRSLERAVEGMVRKAAYKIVQSGQNQSFKITAENLRDFIAS